MNWFLCREQLTWTSSSSPSEKKPVKLWGAKKDCPYIQPQIIFRLGEFIGVISSSICGLKVLEVGPVHTSLVMLLFHHSLMFSSVFLLMSTFTFSSNNLRLGLQTPSDQRVCPWGLWGMVLPSEAVWPEGSGPAGGLHAPSTRTPGSCVLYPCCVLSGTETLFKHQFINILDLIHW